MKLRSRFCGPCIRWWPMGYAKCPACGKNTILDGHRPTETEQHANFELWLTKNGRREEDVA